MNKERIVKVAIVGAGFVGSTTAYTLMVSGLVSEIVLIDINKEKAEGEVMDMNHGMPFVRPVDMYNGDYKDCAGADIVILTAGANQKPGETRIDLVKKNTEIFKGIIEQILKYNTECIILVVTNPVDILTYVTYKLSGFPKNRIIGSGTVLDTSRFRYLIGQKVDIDPRNVHAYIIGEHGDTEVPTWSLATIAGIPMEKYCQSLEMCLGEATREEIFQNVKNAAYHIIDKKGATYYAVALAVRRIVEAIVRNENSILTVSSMIEGHYGISDIALSLPSLVNRQGIVKVLDVPISDEELMLLSKSASALKEAAATLRL